MKILNFIFCDVLWNVGLYFIEIITNSLSFTLKSLIHCSTATVTASATTAADKYESAAVGSSSEIAASSTMKELSFLPQSKVSSFEVFFPICFFSKIEPAAFLLQQHFYIHGLPIIVQCNLIKTFSMAQGNL